MKNAHEKPVHDNAKTSDSEEARARHQPFTTEDLRNLVLEHMLDNAQLFVHSPDKGVNVVNDFTQKLDSLCEMAVKVARASIVNRVSLTALPTFDSVINPIPSKTDTGKFEMRYRIVEQIGNGEPYRDDVLSLDQAMDEYGEDFITSHWGMLGEKCPALMSLPGERKLWFSVVRYPVDSADQRQRNQADDSPPRSPSIK